MTLAVLFVLGAVVAAAAWAVGRPMFEAPAVQRTNFRGDQVPVAVGVLLVAAAIGVEAALRTVETGWRDVEPGELLARSASLVVVLGFGLLGAFDDLAAHGEARGFAGHIKAMLRGELSTGGLKLFAGGLIGIIAVATAGSDSIADLALGAAVVALAANLGNLFDRAPGRTAKVALLAGAILAIATPTAEHPGLAGAAIVLGAGAGLLVPDLRERAMLGDAGSNVLGAALGLGLVLTTGRAAQLVVLAVLVLLNVASERVSFSRVIDRVAPLRAIDRLGRRS